VAARDVALERAPAFQGDFNLLDRFSNTIFFTFETKVHLAQNSKDADQVSLFKICKGR
jgi:hypothetical protein